MTDQDLVLAKQAGDYVTKVYTPPVRSKTPGKIWEDGHVGWYTQFTAKLIQLVRADEREALETKDWTAIMREGSLVTWGDAEELGERVRAAIRARENK